MCTLVEQTIGFSFLQLELASISDLMMWHAWVSYADITTLNKSKTLEWSIKAYNGGPNGYVSVCTLSYGA
jgi:hypothetical protein